MNYEKLLTEVENEGIELFENDRIGRLKGLYFNNTITLNNNINTITEKKCVLVEELGHHYKTAGNILDQSDVRNVKQEKIARAWGYEKLISVLDLINAFKHGARNRYELAEYLDVTEEFIEDVISHYRRKHGLYVVIGNYAVYFNPLSVLEMF